MIGAAMLVGGWPSLADVATRLWVITRIRSERIRSMGSV